MTRDTQSSYRQYRAVLIALMLVASPFAMPLLFTGLTGPSGTAAADTSNTLTTQTQENGTVYIGSEDGDLHAIDAATGESEWTYATGGGIESSPTVVNGTVFVGSDDSTVYAINAETGTERWSYSTGGLVISSPTIINGTVYIGSEDNDLYAIDESTGQLEWSQTTGGAIRSSPTAVGGTVYVGSEDNSLYAFDASTGSEEWSYATGDGIFQSSPTVVDGTVYVGSDDTNVYAIDAETGTEDWSYSTNGVVRSSPTISNNTVYVGSADDNLYALDSETGTEDWSYTAGGEFHSSPTVEDGTVYAGSVDTNVYAIDAGNGSEKWSYSTGDFVRTSPTVLDGTVYVGSEDNSTYALDVETGDEEWSYETGDSITLTSPTVVPSGSDRSEGTRVMLGTLGHHDGWRGTFMDSTIGVVRDQNGDPIAGATVTFSSVSTGSETVTQTDASGEFSIIVESGRYEIEISADGYQTLTDTRDVVEGENLGTFQLAPQQLDLQFNRFVEPGDSTPYTVEFTDDDGTVVDVTENVTMDSSNASVATADTAETEIVGSEGVNGTAVITANYTVGNETYTDTRTVTVATKTVDNLEILPGTWRLSALLDDITIQVILVAIGAAIVATRAASSWAGLGAMELVVIIGWFGGWVPLGIMLLGLFTALFIGLNLAANIDYSVRRA